MKIIYLSILVLLSINCHSQEKDTITSLKIIGYWSIIDTHVFSVEALHLFPDKQFLYTVGYSGGVYHLEFYKGNYFYNKETNQLELSTTHRFLNSCMHDNFRCQPPSLFEVINSDSITNVSPYKIDNKTAVGVIAKSKPDMKRKMMTKEFEQSQRSLLENDSFSPQWEVVPDSIK